MINLLDSKFEDKSFKIFNGGNAGVVEGCGFRVEKKSREDADNAPDYKIVFVDANEGELNEGHYVPKDDDSDKRKGFFVKNMLHLIKQFGVPAIDSVDTYKSLLDYTMKGIKDVQDGDIKLNVAVAYGNDDYPSKYLKVDGFWGIMNAINGKPSLSKNALTVRPTEDDAPTGGVKITGAAGGSEDGNDTEEEW